jgi:uncharacterized membrane protein YeaQ/YmgE (transglycosylase-associated protein family)
MMIDWKYIFGVFMGCVTMAILSTIDSWIVIPVTILVGIIGAWIADKIKESEE